MKNPALPALAEKDVERLCDSLVKQCGGDVVRFSQPRATKQTRGIPDRRYRVHGVVFWFECKAPQGRLSAPQLAFLGAELALGQRIGVGGVSELHDLLIAAKTGTMIMVGGQQLLVWQAKGLRR